MKDDEEEEKIDPFSEKNVGADDKLRWLSL